MKDTYAAEVSVPVRRSNRVNVLLDSADLEAVPAPTASESRKRTASSNDTAMTLLSNAKKAKSATNNSQQLPTGEKSAASHLSAEQRSKAVKPVCAPPVVAKKATAVGDRVRGAPIPTRAQPATSNSDVAVASGPSRKAVSSSTPCETFPASFSSASSSSSSAATTNASLSDSATSIDSELSKFIRAKSSAAHSGDPALCLGQIDRMYSIYYECVDRFTPGQFSQRDINFKMRAILVDWLVDVNWKSNHQASTLWLCVNIIDRFLERVQVARTKLQLVGVTAFLLASKFEEIYPPEVMTCIALTDYHYEREEVLSMEKEILAAIDYQVCVPTGYHFLARYLDTIGASITTRFLALYYYERNLQEADSLLFKPQVLAAATVYCAMRQQAPPVTPARGGSSSSHVWPSSLQRETGLREADIVTCARLMIKHVATEVVTASKRHLVSARTKYAADKFLCVSLLPLPCI